MKSYLKTLALFTPFAVMIGLAVTAIAVTVQALMPRVLDLAALYQRDLPAILGVLVLGALVTYILKNL